MKAIYLFTVCALFALGACKHETDDTPTPGAKTAQSDQSGSAAADQGVDDVNDYVGNQIGGGAHRVGKYDLPCGVASVDSAIVNGKKVYTMKYGSSSPCGYRYKSGSIKFHLVSGTKFSDVGAVNSITFVDYTVVGNASGDETTLNGTLYTTNVNGGFVWQPVISNTSVIVHKIRGVFTTKYGNGVSRDRNYFQRRTWSSTGGWAGLKLTIAGDTTVNNVSGISEIGKTYDGDHDYTMVISNPFIWENCGTNYAGPFVLKQAKARLNVVVPNLEAYFEIEGGYHYSATPTLVNDCSSNAYKISSKVGTATTEQYQLY